MRKQGEELSVIEVRDLRRDFSHRKFFHRTRKEVLRGITFDVFRGEAVAFLGPNGAGKTTTIQHLLGYLFPTKGKVRVLGCSPGDPKVFRSIGYLSEVFHTYRFMTARGVMRYSGELLEMDGSRLEGVISEKLELVGLLDRADAPVKSFSKGMLQRLGLAQSLLHDPELLILDEPMTGLDPEGRRLFIDIMAEQKERGGTLFFSSHILSDVERVCDRAILLRDGEIAAELPVEREHAHHPYRIEVIASESELAVFPREAYLMVERTEPFCSLRCTGSQKQELLRLLLQREIEILTVQQEGSLEQRYLDLVEGR
jgi:ABC-2 type transport system ATP-binding protein